MKLKATLKTLDDLPEHFRELYVERGGQFVLDVDGIKTDADISALKGALDNEKADHRATKSKYSWVGDLTADGIHALRDERDNLETKLSASADPAKFDEALAEGIERGVQQRIRPIERERDTLRDDNASHLGAIGLHEAAGGLRMIHGAIDTATSGKTGVKLADDAVREDLRPYAERVCEIVGGKVLTREGIEGVTPGLPLVEHLKDIQREGNRPHWFAGNEGAGARGGKTSSGVQDNPYKAEHFDPTAQAHLYMEDPSKAKRLASAAGRLDLLPGEARVTPGLVAPTS